MFLKRTGCEWVDLEDLRSPWSLGSPSACLCWLWRTWRFLFPSLEWRHFLTLFATVGLVTHCDRSRPRSLLSSSSVVTHQGRHICTSVWFMASCTVCLAFPVCRTLLRDHFVLLSLSAVTLKRLKQVCGQKLILLHAPVCSCCPAQLLSDNGYVMLQTALERNLFGWRDFQDVGPTSSTAFAADIVWPVAACGEAHLNGCVSYDWIILSVQLCSEYNMV